MKLEEELKQLNKGKTFTELRLAELENETLFLKDGLYEKMA